MTSFNVFPNPSILPHMGGVICVSHLILQMTWVFIFLFVLLSWSQIKAFLNQRITELTNTETLTLQNQVQAVAPYVLQQYTSDAIQSMLSEISAAISLLTNRKTRDLIMILNSKRYVAFE